jgi:hypothetical protein
MAMCRRQADLAATSRALLQSQESGCRFDLPNRRSRACRAWCTGLPLACFFVLTYIAAWCLWAPLLVLRDTLSPAVAFIRVLLGSLVASTIAIVLVAIINGRRGVGSLLGRLVKCRLGLRWYAVVLILPLLAPLGLGVRILLGGRAPTVDFSVIAVLAGSSSRSFQGVRLAKSSAGVVAQSSGCLALRISPAPSASRPPKTSQRFRSRCP